MTFEEFNAAPLDERLHNALRDCCAAEAWIEAVAGGRPYDCEQDLLARSDTATEALDATQLAEALAGHPRIGDRTAGHGPWSGEEQAKVSSADDQVRSELAAANAEYENRFGQVYLVCASGRSAEELLAVCRSRLANDPEEERGVVKDELAKINRLRLRKLLDAGTSADQAQR